MPTTLETYASVATIVSALASLGTMAAAWRVMSLWGHQHETQVLRELAESVTRITMQLDLAFTRARTHPSAGATAEQHTQREREIAARSKIPPQRLDEWILLVRRMEEVRLKFLDLMTLEERAPVHWRTLKPEIETIARLRSRLAEAVTPFILDPAREDLRMLLYSPSPQTDEFGMAIRAELNRLRTEVVDLYRRKMRLATLGDD